MDRAQGSEECGENLRTGFSKQTRRDIAESEGGSPGPQAPSLSSSQPTPPPRSTQSTTPTALSDEVMHARSRCSHSPRNHPASSPCLPVRSGQASHIHSFVQLRYRQLSPSPSLHQSGGARNADKNTQEMLGGRTDEQYSVQVEREGVETRAEMDERQALFL